MTSYQGRHRATPRRGTPSTVVAWAVAAGVVATAATVGAPSAAARSEVTPLEEIARCESAGDPRARNPMSTASGLYQMINTTWAAYGGHRYASTASGATAAQQTTVARRLYAAEGTRPWNASRSCWRGSVADSRGGDGGGRHRAAEPGHHTVVAGDTLTGIAAAHGVTWESIFEGNRDVITDPDRIFIGARLGL